MQTIEHNEGPSDLSSSTGFVSFENHFTADKCTARFSTTLKLYAEQFKLIKSFLLNCTKWHDFRVQLQAVGRKLFNLSLCFHSYSLIRNEMSYQSCWGKGRIPFLSGKSQIDVLDLSKNPTKLLDCITRPFPKLPKDRKLVRRNQHKWLGSFWFFRWRRKRFVSLTYWTSVRSRAKRQTSIWLPESMSGNRFIKILGQRRKWGRIEDGNIQGCWMLNNNSERSGKIH